MWRVPCLSKGMGTALSDSAPKQKTQGLSSRLQQICSQPVVPKGHEKEIIVYCCKLLGVGRSLFHRSWLIQVIGAEGNLQGVNDCVFAGKNFALILVWFLKNSSGKTKRERDVWTSNIHIQYSLPQTESLKLAMTLRVTLASKMSAKVTSLIVGQKIWRSLCAILYPFLALLCLPWKLHPLQCCTLYNYRMLEYSLLGTLTCPHRRSFLESHPAL